MRRMYLHQMEAPTTLLTSLFANSNRDPKKQKKPYDMDDFYLYRMEDSGNMPTSLCGAAAMKMVEKGIFPNWALCVYKDLKNAASGAPPNILCLLSKHAIILAPKIGDDSVKGMLIFEDVVSEQVITMTSESGLELKVQMPKATIRYSAEENLSLPVHA